MTWTLSTPDLYPIFTWEILTILTRIKSILVSSKATFINPEFFLVTDGILGTLRNTVMWLNFQHVFFDSYIQKKWKLFLPAFYPRKPLLFQDYLYWGPDPTVCILCFFSVGVSQRILDNFGIILVLKIYEGIPSADLWPTWTPVFLKEPSLLSQ